MKRPILILTACAITVLAAFTARAQSSSDKKFFQTDSQGNVAGGYLL